MKNKILLLGILAVLFSYSALASISCPCSRPGAEGEVVGFTCTNGTTSNVTLYAEADATDEMRYNLWALKAIEGTDVPVRSLEVSICDEDGTTLALLQTDEEGWIEYEFDSEGLYEVTAGDANLSIEIKIQANESGIETEKNVSLEIVSNKSEANEEELRDMDNQSPAPHEESSLSGDDIGLQIAMISAALLVAVSYFLKKKGVFNI